MFHKFPTLMYDGSMLVASDSFKMILMDNSYVLDSVFTPQVKYTDISAHELPTGGGYTHGGVVMTGTSLVVSGDLMKFISDRTSWIGSGGGFSFRYAVIYDDSDTATPKGLMCGVQMDSIITIGGADTLNIDGFGGDALNPGIIWQMQAPGTVEEFY